MKISLVPLGGEVEMAATVKVRIEDVVEIHLNDYLEEENSCSGEL